MDQGGAWLCCQTGGRSSRLLSSPASLPSFQSSGLEKRAWTQTAWNEPETTVKSSGRRIISCGRKEITGTVHDTWLEGEVPRPMMDWGEYFNQPYTHWRVQEQEQEQQQSPPWTGGLQPWCCPTPWPQQCSSLLPLNLSPYAQELVGATQLHPHTHSLI